MKSLVLLVTALSFLLASGCSQDKPYRESRFLMGTLVEIAAYPDTNRVRTAVAEAYDRMEAIEAATDHRKEDSVLAALRRGERVILSGDLRAVFASAMMIARESSGAFDPTMGKVVSLWGFDMDTPRLPLEQELRNSLKTVGFEKVTLAGSIIKAGSPVWLDLGGVAKGYAVDEAVKVLKEQGASAGIVNAGGDLKAFGKKPGGKRWRIGVQAPDDHQELAGVLEIANGAVATSGDYERYFETGGKRYHHILDPGTGYPARSGLRSVTIVAFDCLLADALSTAIFVMGPEKGLELLKGRDGVHAVLVLETGEVLTTDGVGSEVGFERR
ncbi:MAG: FAD:protein FMN transferase [bacterium]